MRKKKLSKKKKILKCKTNLQTRIKVHFKLFVIKKAHFCLICKKFTLFSQKLFLMARWPSLQILFIDFKNFKLNAISLYKIERFKKRYFLE